MSVHRTTSARDWHRPPGAARSEIRLSHLSSASVLSIRGDIDAPDADAIAPVLDELVTTATEPVAAPVLVIDLSEVAFFGSSGLNLILLARRRAAATGTTVHLVTGPGRGVRRVLEVSGLGSVLPCFSTVEDAAP